jgi:hypothetical protein
LPLASSQAAARRCYVPHISEAAQLGRDAALRLAPPQVQQQAPPEAQQQGAVRFGLAGVFSPATSDWLLALEPTAAGAWLLRGGGVASARCESAAEEHALRFALQLEYGSGPGGARAATAAIVRVLAQGISHLIEARHVQRERPRSPRRPSTAPPGAGSV